MCLYSFHWFYYKELLRKSIATAFKLHVELITDKHHPYISCKHSSKSVYCYRIHTVPLTTDELAASCDALLIHSHNSDLILFLCMCMCTFRSLPFNILANLLSSGFYQMQNVFTNTIYAYIQFGVIQTSALGCFFTLFLSMSIPFATVSMYLYHRFRLYFSWLDLCCSWIYGLFFFSLAPLVRLFVSIFVLLLYACLIQLRNDLNTFIHSLMTIFDDLK